MAERIERLEVRAFRGVPDEMVLDLTGGRSLLVFGDNATGKSTIADALEWYLTGRIDYLSKENRGAGMRNAASPPAQETAVVVEMTGELSGRVTRDDGPPAQVLTAAEQEFCLLRGRDLSDFVEKTKGKKWGALAGILGLESAEQFRADLYTARTNLRNVDDAAQDELRDRAETLRTSRATQADEQSILEAAGALCEKVRITPPESFPEVIDESWLRGQLASGGATERPGSLRALRTELTASQPVDDTHHIDRWNAFVASEDAMATPRIVLLEDARELLDRTDVDACPLCGQPVDVDVLRQRITDILDELNEAAQRLDAVRGEIQALLARIERFTGRLDDLRSRGVGFDVELQDLPPSPVPDIRERVDALAAVDPELLADHGQSLRAWLEGAVELVNQVAPELPEGREATFSELTELTVLARQWHEQRRSAAATSTARDLAGRIYDAYAAEQQQHMAAVLERISKRVADIYGALHPAEGLGSVSIDTVGEKGVELAVDFHGERHQPPQRVLSESHMNSLGLALFLAMHDTYNEQLGFLVLDDVINSFDIEHRGAFAQLLATEYEDRQLIVLTHDHQFYIRLARQTPTWARREFIGWDYERGPRIRGAGPEPSIDAARARLEDDDTIGAGQSARRALEEILRDACEQLEAPLPFRRGTGNEHREATELLNGLRRGLKEHAKNLRSELEPLIKQIEGDLQAALNIEAHAGPGRSSRSEVDAAIGRIEALRSSWTCPDCQTPIWLIGGPDAGRCRCGECHFPPPG